MHPKLHRFRNHDPSLFTRNQGQRSLLGSEQRTITSRGHKQRQKPNTAAIHDEAQVKATKEPETAELRREEWQHARIYSIVY
jgi:hypothetical protein